MRGEQLYALFLCVSISADFPLSLFSLFVLTLVSILFLFFFFLHKVPKSSLALSIDNNRCPSIYLLVHSLTRYIQEKLVRIISFWGKPK